MSTRAWAICQGHTVLINTVATTQRGAIAKFSRLMRWSRQIDADMPDAEVDQLWEELCGNLTINVVNLEKVGP